jgi:hypothetical protein
VELGANRMPVSGIGVYISPFKVAIIFTKLLIFMDFLEKAPFHAA